jgi:hypothetical protein
MTSGSASTVGHSVDLEMKMVLIAAVFAVIKFLRVENSEIFTLIARTFFVIGHGLFFSFYKKAVDRISSNATLSSGDKEKAKKSCQDLLKSLAIRAVLISFVHMKKNMLPPLIVSVFMGFFSLLENPDCYDVLYYASPRLIETVFH